MYLKRNASRIRRLEAQHARNNRAEIVKALSLGEITKRDLLRWGLLTWGGALALKNGLSPFAKSAYAQVPTGTPPSPTFGAQPLSQPMPRLLLQRPQQMQQVRNGAELEAAFPAAAGEVNARRLSWHTDFTSTGQFRNPITNRGPMEGRPPGEFFAHQRWEEFFPQAGYVMSLGQLEDGIGFHPDMPPQEPNSVWSFNAGRFSRGTLPPPLIVARYGEPLLARIYNNMPVNRAENNGFGRNEATTHFHNAHNGSSSDGASNAHYFPGQFYDYHWGTTLARHDTINTGATDRRASGPDGNGGLNLVPGDFRELQGTMWMHDHRFFFTAENVYKGHAGMINYYSGPDRGNEELDDGVNLRLPSGNLLDWANLDFDVNLLIADFAFDPAGQLFFDIFDTDGFLGDLLHVNFAYSPFFEVLPRKYRFRLLNACMSRFLQLVFVNEQGVRVPFQFIANDGNLVTNPIPLNQLDQMGTAERYDVVVDFSPFRIGDRIKLVNILEQTDGRRPEQAVSIAEALNGIPDDPAVGPVMEFRVVGEVESVDVPGVIHRATDIDRSQVPVQLTEQIPIVEPVRTRVIEWVRGGGDSRDTATGQCIPECGDKESFPWTVRVNGEDAHSLNANRVSALIPRPGEVEHWTFVNGGGGWDHPIHLHFEEGVTMNRGGEPIPATERLVRKDVWRLREGGQVTFQVQFGEYGGAYVNHCHNTVHEDFAMLMRYDVLTEGGSLHSAIIPTPNPTPDGVEYLTPEILPEGDPTNGAVQIATDNTTPPNGGDPGNGDPGNGDPGNGDPGNGDPGNGDPGNGDPDPDVPPVADGDPDRRRRRRRRIRKARRRAARRFARELRRHRRIARGRHNTRRRHHHHDDHDAVPRPVYGTQYDHYGFRTLPRRSDQPDHNDLEIVKRALRNRLEMRRRRSAPPKRRRRQQRKRVSSYFRW